MKVKGKTVLVTGAGGFIGSHLVERLVQEGCKVKALLHYDARADRSNLEFLSKEVLSQVQVISGDITDAFFMLRSLEKCEVVFHLAALIGIPYSYEAPASYVDTNIKGTLNVLEAARYQETPKVVHTSTSEVYGTALYTPIDEKHPLQGQSPYSASKIAADKLAESFHCSFKLPVATARPFNTFGPRQSARAIVPTIIAQLLSEKTSLRLGSLTPVRDLNFVQNTVDGFLAIAESDAAIGEVINLGSGRGVTIGQVAELLMEIVGKKLPVQTDDSRIRPEKSEVFTLIANAEKAEKLLGWKPKISLEKGLAQTVDFIRNHQALFRHDEYQR